MPDYETKRIFAENLNALLEASDKTQLDLAKAMGVAASSVNSWCQAEKMPRMDKVEWMADYFHVPKSALIEENGARTISIITDEFSYAMHGHSGNLTDSDKKALLQMAQQLVEAHGKRKTDE